MITLRRPNRTQQEQPLEQLRPARASRAETRIALVVMPFVSRYHPSIQVGLLTAIARKRGFSVTPLHLNLDFAKQIGSKAYEALCAHRGCASGEWLFSREAFGDKAPEDEDAFFNACDHNLRVTMEHAKLDRERYSAIRREDVPRYLDALMTSIPWGDFDVVGFSSTFEQNVASFALAARIKKAYPNVQTLFGGANFDGEMGVELVRSIEQVDYAIVGEADEAFPDFLEAIHEGRDPASVSGVICRRNGHVEPPKPRAPFTDLDSLPTPSYEEYFERSEALRLSARDSRSDFLIPFESARGCWWGAKHHCTFCGLNSQTMKFRAKSPTRVKEELADLTRQTESFRFQAVDNILESTYLDTLIPELTRTRTDYTLFYEVKSNLTRAQIKTLAQGGVRTIQPGIESLSSHVLSLMRKGAKAIQQVNLLRWSLYYGVSVAWNMLWGFPDETEADYREQMALIDRLPHLQPPDGSNRIWMERFSPIYFDDAFKKKRVEPERSYAHVYPPSVDLTRIAYFFDYELEGTLESDVYDQLELRLVTWRDSWKKNIRRPTLYYWSSPGLLRIEDRRDPGNPKSTSLRGVEATIYEACSDLPKSAAAILKSLSDEEKENLDVDAITRILVSFDERTLMMREGDKFLSLALPAVEGR